MRSLIQPLRALRPYDTFNYAILNNLLYYTPEGIYPFNQFGERVEYINNLYENTKLHKESHPCFYAYRSTSNISMSIGLIAKINTHFIGKNIFPHEQIIKEKSNAYSFFFKNKKIQINPVVLVHRNISKAEHFLECLVSRNKPSLSMKEINYTYEIWPIYEYDIIKEIYSPLETLLIADGHHRIDSFAKLSNVPFFMALLISSKYLFSRNILRKYNYLSSSQENIFLDFFKNNFCLKRIEDCSKLNSFNKFIIFLNEKIFVIDENSNDLLIRKILNFLETNINYDINGNLNFSNTPLNNIDIQVIKNNLPLSPKCSIIIPSIELTENIKVDSCYPPHSTWFEPKSVDGLMSMIL